MSATTRRLGPADEALIAAEQEIAELRRKGDALSAAGDRGDHDEIWNRVSALHTYIAETAPDSIIGAAVKLRRLADERAGLEAGQGTGDVESVRQILATVERSVDAPPPPSPAIEAPNPNRDPFMAFTAQARLLRGLGEVRIARRAAEQHGVDVSAYPPPPSFEEIEEQYVELMREWAGEAPRSAGAAVAYIDLAMAIVFQAMREDVDQQGVFPVASFDDLAFAAQLLGSTGQWANARDLEEGREERAMRRTPAERAGGPA